MVSIFNKCLVILVAISLWLNNIDGLATGNDEINRTKRQAINFFEKEMNFMDMNVPVLSANSKSSIHPIPTINEVPKAPQNIRIRGDGVINNNEGRVEVYSKNFKLWTSVCDDRWTKDAADTTCKMLGFERGAREVNRNDRYGPSTFNQKVKAILNCLNGRCFDYYGPCFGKSAGVSCKLNEGCPTGWISYKGACYQVENFPRTFQEANQFCNRQNSKLVYPLTVDENNFLSNVLKTQYKDIFRVWTGGYYTEIIMDDGRVVKLWKFKSTIHTTNDWNLDKLWFPGFNNEQLRTKRPISNPKLRSCIAMSTAYQKSSDTISSDVDYFWWENLSCKEKLPFICQKIIRQGQTGRDCINSDGSDYRGTVSRTEHGSVCTKWTTPGLGINPSSIPNAGLGDHNYCRNPDNEMRPWCWVNKGSKYGFCDIPKCGELPPIQTTTVAPTQSSGFGKGGCPQHLYHCPSMIPYRRQCISISKVCDKRQDCVGGEDENIEKCRSYMCNKEEFFCEKDLYCITKNFVCDGRPHCSDRSDEKNCAKKDPKNLFQSFNRYAQKKAPAYSSYVIINISPEDCLGQCISNQINFPCKSFNFVEANPTSFPTCSLFTEIWSEQSLVSMTDGNIGAYYSIKSECPNKNDFRCNWGFCVHSSYRCNGKDDCGDESDEANCSKNNTVPFDIRLIGGANSYEGLVNVRHNGEWGYVCDRFFDTKDADVICRMLGFEKLAEAAIKMGAYKYQHDELNQILLSELNCTGTELSLEMCKHAPWRKHKCTKDQVAGVICRVERACTNLEHRCKSDKTCISLNMVCDGVHDCSDKSDEPVGKCKLKVELVGTSTPSKGRIEVTIGHSRGTVCDDAFDINDAKVVCKMLGFTNKVALLKKGEFPVADRGLIAVANLHCTGYETSLEQCPGFQFSGFNLCQHEEDVGIDCNMQEIPIPSYGTIGQVMKPHKNPVPACGRRPIVLPTSKIVGGNDAMYGTIPWQVKMVRKFENRHHCGGTIISDRYIITAAHCFRNEQGVIIFTKRDLYLKFGDGDTFKLEQSEQKFFIDEIIYHPDYDPQTYNNDLAIMKIKPNNGRYIEFSNHVQPACLPSLDSKPDQHTKCLVSGWGHLKFKGNVTTTLKYAQVPLINLTQCDAMLRQKLTKQMLCAGYRAGNIDTCQGDSGGPLVCESKGKHVLFGVTSWGNGCGQPNSPGVYVDIKEFLPYIKQITGVDY